ncbi:MAG: hypothetical protein ACRD8W_05600 [Nitrososphaeraceae archaeon]
MKNTNNMAEFTSKITISRPNSPSLRTTIPEGVAKLIELKAGDELLWKVNIKSSKVEVIIYKR